MAAPDVTPPRIPPIDEATATEEQRKLLRQTERAGTGARELRTYAHHPVLATNLLPFAHYIATASTLAPRHRALLILRTAWLCRSAYTWAHHTNAARRAGLERDDLTRIARGPDAPGWQPFEATLLRVADELHVNAFVSDATWQALTRDYDTQRAMDAVFTVAEITMIAGTVNSLGLAIDPSTPPESSASLRVNPSTPPESSASLGASPSTPESSAPLGAGPSTALRAGPSTALGAGPSTTLRAGDRLPTEIPHQVNVRPMTERLIGKAARITPLEPAEWTPEVRAWVDRANTGRPVAAIYRTYARHLAMDKPRTLVSEHIRQTSTLSGRIRELLILRIGWLCRSEYEWAAHAPAGRRAGLTDADFERIVAPTSTGALTGGANRADASLSDAYLLRAVDELHRDDVVSDATWNALAAQFDTRQLLDILTTIGGYRMVSMALNTFGVQLEPGAERFPL